MDPFRDTWAPKGCWTTGTTTWTLTCQHSFPSEFLVGSNTSISIWTQQTFLHWGTGLRTGQAGTNNIRERHQGPDTTKWTAQGRVWCLSLNSQPWSAAWDKRLSSPFEIHKYYTYNTQHNKTSQVFSIWFFPPCYTEGIKKIKELEYKW